jgi:hypothetical protein
VLEDVWSNPQRLAPSSFLVASRFYRWQKAGVWQHLFETVQQQADAEGGLN